VLRCTIQPLELWAQGLSTHCTLHRTDCQACFPVHDPPACTDKYHRGIYDPSCTAPPPPPIEGKECSSQGPANFYSCCAEKEATREYDARQVAAHKYALEPLGEMEGPLCMVYI